MDSVNPMTSITIKVLRVDFDKGPQRNSTEPALVNIQQCKYQKQMTYNEHLGIYLVIWRPLWKSSVLPSW